MSGPPLHTDQCWCATETTRITTLDAHYPARCQLVGTPGTPATGRRTCILVAGHTPGCAHILDPPGGPCHYCGNTYPGLSCPDCWAPVDGMAHADLKAIFARSDLSLGPPGGTLLERKEDPDG